MLEDAYNDRGSRTTMQWVSQVTKGLETSFSMVTLDAVEAEQLSSVNDLAMRVNELKNFVSQPGLQNMFMIHTISEDGTQRDVTVPRVNLLDNYGTVSLEQVKASTRWVKEYGDDHLVWAETITQRLVEASCESNLREQVSEELMGIDPFCL